MRGIIKTVLVGAALMSGSLIAHSADRAMIVMDASGSMWGQINGVTKIEIARETLGTVLQSVPADFELGLIAYGHRQRGECGDIEEVVSPGVNNRDQITTAVNGFNPKGKTPLTEAVRQAAESLRYSEEKATVILVTDGIETCEADPCAVASELERDGIDFTAHVVGFGLSEEEGQQVACLAENTGGDFILADNAEELGDALEQTVVAPPEPPAPQYTLLDGMEDGIDRPGNDYRRFDLPVADPAICQATCRDEAQCVAWTFVKPGVQAESARCWLKNPQPAQVANDCCISGVFDKEPPNPELDVRAVLTQGGPPLEEGRWDVTDLTTDETKTSFGAKPDFVFGDGPYRIAYRINRVEEAIEINVDGARPSTGEVVLNAGVVSFDVAYAEGGEKIDGVRIDVETDRTQDTQFGTYNAVTYAGPAKVRVRSGRAEMEYDINVIAGEAMARTFVLPAGRATGSATFTPGGEAVPDAKYEILKAEVSLTGDREKVETQFGQTDVILAPGDYVMLVTAGRATAEAPFTVNQNSLTNVVVPMDAGVVSINAPGAVRTMVMSTPSALTGEQKQIYRDFKPELQLILNAGTYVARAEIGDERRVVEQEFTVTAGQRTDVSLQ